MYQGEVFIRRTLGLLAFTSLLGQAPLASADTPLWAEATREGAQPQRWVHATGFVQPALVFRRSGEGAPRSDHAFLIQRARLGIEAQPFAWARLKLDVGFAPSPALRDGYVELRAHPYLRVRIGQFRVPALLPHGFDEGALAFIDRPLYLPNVGSGDRTFLSSLTARDLGAMVAGRFGDLAPSSMTPVFEYRLGVFNGAGPNMAAANLSTGFLYAARLRLHVLGYPAGADSESDLARNVLPRVAVGGAVYSNCDPQGLWSRGFTLDLEARWRGAYLSGSFLWLRNGRAHGGQLGYEHCAPTPAEESGLADPPLFFSSGAHAQLQYVLPDVLLPKRHELEVSVRFDYVNPRSPEGGGFLGGGPGDPGYELPESLTSRTNAPTQARLSVGLTWLPMGDPTFRARLSYHYTIELEAHGGSDPTAPLLESVRNDLIWLQLSASL